ncbi:MAG: proton-conducting transporter membrane subunit, partial [Mycobacteriales bacterium]
MSPSAGAAAQLAPLAIALPVVVACLLLSAGRRLPHVVTDAVATGAALGVVGLCSALFVETGGGRVVTWVGGWTPKDGHSVGIVLVADRLGSGMALLAATLMLAALVYSWRYYDSVDAHLHALMLLFLAGMAGFALTGDLFDMFVFFELMGAVAYALTGFKVEDPSALQGGLNFGVINSLGAYLSLTGIGIIYARTGQLQLPLLARSVDAAGVSTLVVLAFVLI